MGVLYAWGNGFQEGSIQTSPQVVPKLSEREMKLMSSEKSPMKLQRQEHLGLLLGVFEATDGEAKILWVSLATDYASILAHVPVISC